MIQKDSTNSSLCVRLDPHSVAPGFVRTPLIAGIAAKVDQHLTSVPQRRAGEPAEIADMALFLCSERANYSNGSIS